MGGGVTALSLLPECLALCDALLARLPICQTATMAFDLILLQPEDILGLLDDPGRDETSAQLAQQHPRRMGYPRPISARASSRTSESDCAQLSALVKAQRRKPFSRPRAAWAVWMRLVSLACWRSCGLTPSPRRYILMFSSIGSG